MNTDKNKTVFNLIKQSTMIHRPRGREKKPVVCLNTGIVYPSLVEAAEALNVSHSSISRSITLDKPVKGLMFKVA